MIEESEKPEEAKRIESTMMGLNVPFEPYNHTTTQVPVNPNMAIFGANTERPPQQEKEGFLQGTWANLQNSMTGQFIHGAWNKAESAYLDAWQKDPNFNPMQFQDKFINIEDQYQPYLLNAESEADMDFRLNRIYHQQSLNDDVKNSSWASWVVGGGIGLGVDLALMSRVPAIAGVKYASLGKTVAQNLAVALPGAAAYGFGSAGAEQLDKIDGNVHDFLQDSAIRTVFATALFGGGAVAMHTAEKMALWDLQSYVADAVNGIGYRLKVGEKGEIEGLEAYAMRDGVGADKVNLAQDKADSVYFKGGLFKIPYIGKAAENLLSNKFLGSTALSALSSSFKDVALVYDLAWDHGIITKGVAEGKSNPMKFYTLLQKTRQEIAQQENIFNALHAERNGFKSDSYIYQSAMSSGKYLRQKTLEKMGSEIGDRPYISHDEFSEEVQNAIISEKPHAEAAVNAAAGMFRKSMDKYWVNFREAYNLPKDWMPSRTAMGYLMRVYDTNFLNNHQNEWIDIIAAELQRQDKIIQEKMLPINSLSDVIKDFESKHTEAVESLANIEAKQAGTQLAEYIPIHKGTSLIPISKGKATIPYENNTVQGEAIHINTLSQMRIRLRAMKDVLENELRSNPELHLMIDDWNGLSADESKELKSIIAPLNKIKNNITKQKKVISEIKAERSRKLSYAKKEGKIEKAIPKAKKFKEAKSQVEIEEGKLHDLETEYFIEDSRLQEQMQNGTINRRFFNRVPDTALYKLRDPEERLKFRKTYHEEHGLMLEEEEAHLARKAHAKAYYDTIMNQNAEQTINDVMGRFTGNRRENPTKARTLMVPDELLYNNKFMTKDVLSKVANYMMWLGRRTHLKNIYKGASIDGGFEPIIESLLRDFNIKNDKLQDDISLLRKKSEEPNLSDSEKLKYKKELAKVDKSIKKNKKAFELGKKQINFAYEKMAGISDLSQKQRQILNSIKSLNVCTSLGFLPASMITDLTTVPMKQGFLPFIIDGVAPAIESLNGFLKTHDSESFRGSCAAANLGLHHIGHATTSRQLDLATNQYLNVGRIPAALDRAAQFSSNISGATSIDNFLQRLTSSVAQSNVIRHLESFEKGTLSKIDKAWLLRYGIQPETEGEAILKAFRKDGGGKTKLGGYQSNFWKWDDIKSSNKVSDAVFRSTYDTIISANALDSPIWMDENGGMNIMGPIIKGFKGWAFASLNRYLIPTLQQPDQQKLMGFVLMTASAALVSPTRRLARGKDAYPENFTKAQIVGEILADSPQFAWLNESLNDLNLLSGGALLTNFKNDKYRDRTIIGLAGPGGSSLNKFGNFAKSIAANDMNEQDTMQMLSMVPVINSLYGYNATQHIVQGFGLPKYAHK